MIRAQATASVRHPKSHLLRGARLYVCLSALLLAAVTDAFAQSPVTISPAVKGMSDSSAPAKLTPVKGSRTHTITMSNKSPSYSPPNLTIEAGDIVRWVNSEQSDSHSVHERAGVMISPDVAAGKEWCYQFLSEGEYTYTCRLHPWMRGRIIVKARDVNIREFQLPADWPSQGTTFIRSGASLWIANSGALLRLEPDSKTTFTAALLLPEGARSGLSRFVSADTLWLLDPGAGSLRAYDFKSQGLKPQAERKLPGKVTAATATSTGVVWLFDSSSANFVSLDLATGQSTVAKHVTLHSPPAKMLAGDTGKLGLIEQSRKHIAIFDPASGDLSEFALPPEANLSDIVAATGGLFWASDAGRNKIIKIEKGWLTEYTVPTSFSSPQGLAADAEGGVWFAETLANKIGLLREGQFEEYIVPTPESRPTRIGIDGEGNLWFVQSGANKIGLISSATVRALRTSIAQRVERPCVQPEPTRSDANRNQPHGGGENVNGHRHNQD